MSKEWLEDKKKQLNNATIFINENGNEAVEVSLSVLNKLIEQAERIQEFELEINDWREEVQKWQQFYKESEESHLETKELLHSTINEIKRYREALEKIEMVTEFKSEANEIANKVLEGDDEE